MAQTVIWSNEALDDVDRLAEYIHRDSPLHARLVVERIVEIAEDLLVHPALGRMVPELDDPNIRERFLYSYRLIYELRAGGACILAVIHGKRLLESVESLRRGQ